MRKELPCEPRAASDAKCCPHVQRVIDDRTAKHLKREQRLARKYATDQEKAVQQSADQHSQTMDAIQGLAKALSARRSEKVSPSGG
jgi:hypothetical protein